MGIDMGETKIGSQDHNLVVGIKLGLPHSLEYLY
jgi:hypothetical protein